jgi:hypothetical protein
MKQLICDFCALKVKNFVTVILPYNLWWFSVLNGVVSTYRVATVVVLCSRHTLEYVHVAGNCLVLADEAETAAPRHNLSFYAGSYRAASLQHSAVLFEHALVSHGLALLQSVLHHLMFCVTTMNRHQSPMKLMIKLEE